METVVLTLVIASVLQVLINYFVISSLFSKKGCSVSESDLNKEIYLVVGVNYHKNKAYYLLKDGSKIVTCWVSEKEGFKNFDYSSEEMRLVPKNNY